MIYRRESPHVGLGCHCATKSRDRVVDITPHVIIIIIVCVTRTSLLFLYNNIIHIIIIVVLRYKRTRRTVKTTILLLLLYRRFIIRKRRSRTTTAERDNCALFIIIFSTSRLPVSFRSTLEFTAKKCTHALRTRYHVLRMPYKKKKKNIMLRLGLRFCKYQNQPVQEHDIFYQ